MGLLEQVEQLYPGYKSILSAKLQEYFVARIDGAIGGKKFLEDDNDWDFTLEEGWVEERTFQQRLQPSFPELKGSSFPERYQFFTVKKDDLTKGEVYFVPEASKGVVAFGLIDSDDEQITGSFEHTAHVGGSLLSWLDVLMSQGEGLVLTKKQFEQLLILKFIIQEYDDPCPQINTEAYYGDTWEELEFNGGLDPKGTARNLYRLMLWEMLEDDLFKDGRYALSDKSFFQQFLLGLVAGREKPILTTAQSHCIVLLARSTRTIEFISYLSKEDSIYSSEITRIAWTEIFFQQLYFDFFTKQEHSFPALLRALDTAEEKENPDAQTHLKRTQLVLQSVIAEARSQKKRPLENRHPLLSERMPGQPRGNQFLNSALTTLLFEAKATPETKGEKHRARNFAIQAIEKCDTIQNLKLAFSHYIAHPMVKTHRHPTIDDVIGFFRYCVPFAHLSKEFYSDAEISIRRAARAKLETFKSDPEYEVVKAFFDANENAECLRTILPVARLGA